MVMPATPANWVGEGASDMPALRLDRKRGLMCVGPAAGNEIGNRSATWRGKMGRPFAALDRLQRYKLC